MQLWFILDPTDGTFPFIEDGEMVLGVHWSETVGRGEGLFESKYKSSKEEEEKKVNIVPDTD